VDPSKLAKLNDQSMSGPGLAFTAGAVDPRIMALLPEPRLFASDYQGSDLGEVVLPAGVQPAAADIVGVYRASEFSTSLPPTGQTAFNYWCLPAQGGSSQLAAGPPARLVGLRLGIGRSVPVVVVIRGLQPLGVLVARRAAWVDGAFGGSLPLYALPGWTAPSNTSANAYAVVAVDRFGHPSAPSKTLVIQSF
jgi:hypothetical protein